MPVGIYKRKVPFHSKATRKKISLATRKNGVFKGNEACYSAFHRWLKTHYGIANKCESKKCLNGTRFEWALKRGKRYEHKRENFKMLCSACHRAYDRNHSPHKRNTSGFRGVSRSLNKWQTMIMVKRTVYYLGSFFTKEEAAKAYNGKAKELLGKHAYQNKI